MKPASPPLRLLAIDDEPAICEFICDVATTLNIEAVAAYDSSAFYQLYDDNIDIIVLDIVMPQVDGIALLRQLAGRQCSAALILISGFDERVLQSTKDLAQGLGLNVIDHLHKPIRLGQLEQSLKKIKSLPSDHEDRPTRRYHVDELRRAIAAQAFTLHYQPQVDLASGEVVAAEALVRWKHEDGELILPDHFIGLAETHQLIDTLTDIVLDMALATCRQCQEQGQPIRIAINLSARSLTDLTLPDRLEARARSISLPLDRLVLELTESSLIQEQLISLDILNRLRVKGMRLSIDDFGTGASTLDQLRRIPFNELKIDRSFLTNFEHTESAEVIIRNTIELGHALHMPIVAEGIESMAAWDFLCEQGCDMGQGFFIARPMPREQLLDWLDRREVQHHSSR